MTSQITRKQTLINRVATVEFSLVAKDVTDDAIIKKFGDVIITPTGSFNDPNDLTYPAFYVNAGPCVPFFTVEHVQAQFVNDTLTLADIQRRANLWGDKIQLDIQNGIVAKRALHDTTTSTVTITI
jgi:hypothetical protein